MWTEYARSPSRRSGRKTSNFKCPSAIPAWGFLRSGPTRYSMRFLLPSLTALAWDYGSAAPSLNRMVGAYGLTTTLPVARGSLSPYPPRSTATNDDSDSPSSLDRPQSFSECIFRQQVPISTHQVHQ